jgi:hypothetical protein
MPNFNFTAEDIAGSSREGRRFYKEYKTWQRIIGKCHNVRHARYPNYGGRGFIFDDFYRYSFLNFLNEVGECPEPKNKNTIERIDNDKGYVTGNMKWLVSELQARNKTNNKIIEHDGKKFPLAVWCKDLGLNYSTITTRLKRGMSFAEAIMETPPRITREIIYKGEITTLTTLCSELGLNFDTACSLHGSGMTGDEIAECPEAYAVKKPKLYTYKGETLTLPKWAKKFGIHRAYLRDRLKVYSFEFLCDKYLNSEQA